MPHLAPLPWSISWILLWTMIFMMLTFMTSTHTPLFPNKKDVSAMSSFWNW